jgi:hypothetical protein
MRILTTGASGSGTTTLGRALAGILGFGFLDVDDYYWLPTKPPYLSPRPKEQRLPLILKDLRQYESAVVSGSIMEWGPELEDSFDLIVFLYLDAAIRVQRLIHREKKEVGHAELDFLIWASQYDSGPKSGGRSLARHQKWLGQRTCKVIKLEGDLTVQRRCDLVLAALPQPAPAA